MYNTCMLRLKKNSDKYGKLVPIEGENDIPFKIKRVYYIYGVDRTVCRGFHAHSKLHQVLICVNGSVKIRLKNNSSEEIVFLEKPEEALYIGPMIWREMFEFSENAVLLVLASDYYDDNEYIRNWDKYVDLAESIFGKEE